MKSAALTIAAATVGSGAGATTYPVLLQFPVVSGTAQVGKVLTSTTGTWTGATSFTYQWSGNKVWIPGATAATYIPVASDVGHTLTSTVVATGSPGAKSSATSAATVPIVAASPGSPPPPLAVRFHSSPSTPIICRRPVRTATTASPPRRPGRRQTTRSAAAMSSLPRPVLIRTFKVSARSAIARPLRAASTGRAASTSPHCSAAAQRWGLQHHDESRRNREHGRHSDCEE